MKTLSLHLKLFKIFLVIETKQKKNKKNNIRWKKQ